MKRRENGSCIKRIVIEEVRAVGDDRKRIGGETSCKHDQEYLRLNKDDTSDSNNWRSRILVGDPFPEVYEFDPDVMRNE